MPSPFPGMDPYLETPDLWPDVHHGLINHIRGSLQALLRPNYVVRVKLRIYESDEPGLIDPEIKEARLEIGPPPWGSPVTVIEVVSPANKIVGTPGRLSYMTERERTLESHVDLVEIDLLRSGMECATRPLPTSSDYRISVSYTTTGRAHLWPTSVRDRLPSIPVPLRANEPSAVLDLAAVLDAAYENGAYDMSVDYRKEPEPPLKGADKTWADKLLRRRGLR